MSPAAEQQLKDLGFEEAGSVVSTNGQRAKRYLKQKALPHILIELPDDDLLEESWLALAIFSAGMKAQKELTEAAFKAFTETFKTTR
jgi:hypothetical protein